MKNSVSQLPEGYKEVYKLDLQKDKKTAALVNVLSLLLMAIFAFIGNAFVRITALFDMEDGIALYMIRFAVMIVGTVAYIILHELVHGVAMKHFGAEKVKYGFTGLYAFAGTDSYFAKRPYIVIALAPIVVWGVVLLVLSLIVPKEWFWVVYFIQIVNLSGAAGDLYVTYKFSKLPENILVQDTGVAMTVYSSCEN